MYVEGKRERIKIVMTRKDQDEDKWRKNSEKIQPRKKQKYINKRK
jgi:hypothetical protein